MKRECSKNRLEKKNFYLPILNELKLSTNLTKIREKLNISKQQLNYYLRRLKDSGVIINKSKGLWELTNASKNPTKYGRNLNKDTIRGHANIVNIIPNKFPENWDKRLELIKKKGINYKLVGAKETTPRIKVLGRKVWLCNKHIRIFDKPGESYYGLSGIESRKQSFYAFYKVLNALENKLGVSLRPYDFQWKKEHYAFIKNDLAIDQNKKGIIWRISDEEGEWLLVDDSLEMGGELENTGKKALTTNLQMQKWWNKKKENKFKIDDDYIQKGFGQTNDMIMRVTQNQTMFAENMESHINAIKILGKEVKGLSRTIKGLKRKNQDLNLELKSQKRITDFF